MNIRVGIVVSATFLTAAPTAQAIVYPIQHDQNNSCSGNATNSQEYEPLEAAIETLVADDFIVPSGDFGWDLRVVAVNGFYSEGGGPMPAVNVAFHHNAGGLPGAEVAGCRYDEVDPSVDVAGDLSISLSPPCTLRVAADANTQYWLVVQARMDYGSLSEQWFWVNRGTQSSSPAAFRNPGGGIDVCADWGARGADCGIAPGSPDQCFTVFGYDGIFSHSFEVGDTSVWSHSVVN